MFEHIVNQRKDMLHKLSTGLLRSYDVICLENAPPPDIPLGHPESIRADWHELRRQLRYKADWYEKCVVEVDGASPTAAASRATPIRDGDTVIGILDEGLRLLA